MNVTAKVNDPQHNCPETHRITKIFNLAVKQNHTYTPVPTFTLLGQTDTVQSYSSVSVQLRAGKHAFSLFLFFCGGVQITDERLNFAL